MKNLWLYLDWQEMIYLEDVFHFFINFEASKLILQYLWQKTELPLSNSDLFSMHFWVKNLKRKRTETCYFPFNLVLHLRPLHWDDQPLVQLSQTLLQLHRRKKYQTPSKISGTFYHQFWTKLPKVIKLKQINCHLIRSV